MREFGIAPDFSAARRPGPIQRQCDCSKGSEQCEECKSKSGLQRHSAAYGGLAGSTGIPSAIGDALHEGGVPLDPRTLEFMESRFGHDFSRVRLHTSEQASESTLPVQANACTFGNNIAFRRGLYDPGTGQGRRLLAHELAHVVQQSAGIVPPSGIDSGPSDPLEIAADRMAADALTDLASRGASAGTSGTAARVQRQASPHATTSRAGGFLEALQGAEHV